MKLVLRKSNYYYPEWNGNRELPEEDRIKIHFEYLTASDKESFFVTGAEQTSAGSLARRCWLEKVIKIENLDIELDGKIVEATPENILSLPDMFELFTEVSTHIFTASSLTEEQLKN